MKWLVFNTLIIWNYISCQDIVFPSDEETYVNGNIKTVKKLI